MKFKTLFIALISVSMILAGTAFADVNQIGGNNAGANVEDVAASAAGVVGDINSGNTSIGRSSVVPHEHLVPNAPAHFDKATPDHRFIPIKNLLTLQTVYTAEEAAAMLAAAEGDMEVKIRPMVAPGEATTSVTVTTIETIPAGTRQQLALGTLAADGVDAISVDLLATVVDQACKMGATHIVFMGEGVNRILKSFAWGAGLSTSYAHMSDSGDDGMLMTGGLGVSGGTVGYKHLPWLQFALVKVQ